MVGGGGGGMRAKADTALALSLRWRICHRLSIACCPEQKPNKMMAIYYYFCAILMHNLTK